MIPVLHRGGVCPNDYNITWGGGSFGTPKSDYVICARPHTSNKANSKNASKTSKSVNQLSSYSLCVFYVHFSYVCKHFVIIISHTVVNDIDNENGLESKGCPPFKKVQFF